MTHAIAAVCIVVKNPQSRAENAIFATVVPLDGASAEITPVTANELRLANPQSAYLAVR